MFMVKKIQKQKIKKTPKSRKKKSGSDPGVSLRYLITDA
jgi:hypothetical protein